VAANFGGIASSIQRLSPDLTGATLAVTSVYDLDATDAQPGGAATDPAIKLVVLIDKGSASASEIVAGALRDTKRATLVGETSFGKGTVQEWTPLEGAGGFRLTIAKWLTPNQEWIHHKGITPDVAVTVPANLPAGQDPVLDKGLEVLGAKAALDRAA